MWWGRCLLFMPQKGKELDHCTAIGKEGNCFAGPLWRRMCVCVHSMFILALVNGWFIFLLIAIWVCSKAVVQGRVWPPCFYGNVGGQIPHQAWLHHIQVSINGAASDSPEVFAQTLNFSGWGHRSWGVSLLIRYKYSGLLLVFYMLVFFFLFLGGVIYLFGGAEG